MASLAGPTNPFPRPFNRRTQTRNGPRPDPQPSNGPTNWNTLTVAERKSDPAKAKEIEARERKEETNRKIASQKAISIILRREATKAVIEKKKGNSKKLLPRTVLEALHERITALRWESALKVFELLREQLWYRPNTGIYIKLIVMLGKCKQPEKAHILFQAMIDEGCVVDREAYTALMSAYSRSDFLDKAFSILEQMKEIRNCQPDVFTYSILIKSCVQFNNFGKVQSLLSDMEIQGIKPNTITYNTLLDAYGKAKKFSDMESLLVQMLRQRDCQPDVWTMNSTLRAFGGSGQIEMMEKFYEKFQMAGIEPSIKTFNVLLDSYGKTGNYEKMSAVMQYMQRYHFSWTLVTYNIVIDAFGRAGDLKQMEFLFQLMQSERVKPNCVTLCSLVRAYGSAGKAEKIGSVLRFIENSDVMLDTVFFNCLADAYGMMGCFSEMKGVIEMMRRRGCEPDKVTYRTMIKAYTLSGMSRHAKELHKELASL
ncbi:pentatricopeptide repeat-containing protein at5g48730 chloroplastic [Phtheirospermum japonicum]|uniref:Pentatricopeptide repeat-containing protein at5g48730 chloroplastic n=1 Tax=Phtheirospermum japonicum TaxID=374723 RepID=A0A830B065_9LAMI|nr:pentatricopeptide repeat-containing protein at5g48730 chloroplastic [Phtheirospermum japonicum]